MRVPDWYQLALLSLASFRVWRLLAVDSLLDWARVRVVPSDEGRLVDFVFCPWCLGFWIVLAWFAAFWVWPHAATVAAAPLAASTLVGAVSVWLDRESADD